MDSEEAISKSFFVIHSKEVLLMKIRNIICIYQKINR